MSVWDEKTRVTVGQVSLELPAILATHSDRPLDSTAAVFEGHGVTVIVDQGPFSDRLDSHVGKPEYREGVMPVAGATGRTVSFRNPAGGTYTVAVHVPEPMTLTVVVQADESVPEHVARNIVESIQTLA